MIATGHRIDAVHGDSFHEHSRVGRVTMPASPSSLSRQAGSERGEATVSAAPAGRRRVRVKLEWVSDPWAT